jgi:hypothetical protein
MQGHIRSLPQAERVTMDCVTLMAALNHDAGLVSRLAAGGEVRASPALRMTVCVGAVAQ